MREWFNNMTDAAREVLTGTPASAVEKKQAARAGEGTGNRAQDGKFESEIPESAVAEPVVRIQEAVPWVPPPVVTQPEVQPVKVERQEQARRDEGYCNGVNIGATAEQVGLVAAQIDAVKAEVAAIAGNSAGMEKLAKTVDQQMEVIRDLSRRVRELDDEIVSGLVMRPMLNGLLLIHDGIASQLRIIASGGVVDSKAAFAALAADVNELLAQYDVRPVHCDGGAFDPKVHKVVGTVAEKAPRANEIAEVTRVGFEWSGRQLRRPEVIVVK